MKGNAAAQKPRNRLVVYLVSHALRYAVSKSGKPHLDLLCREPAERQSREDPVNHFEFFLPDLSQDFFRAKLLGMPDLMSEQRKRRYRKQRDHTEDDLSAPPFDELAE